MTETEWDACADPMPMLEFLRGKASERKLRLFAVACCKRIRHLFFDERSLKALDVLERFADGMADDEDLALAGQDASSAPDLMLSGWVEEDIIPAAAAAAPVFSPALVSDRIIQQAGWAEAQAIAAAAKGLARAKKKPLDVGAIAVAQKERRQEFLLHEPKAQCHLLSDLFGNPFRPKAASQSWLAWYDGTIQKLAQAIYDDRAFDRLPLLADALEDAGCAHADILAHCRGRGEHVRGCWAVDLLLDKS